MQHVVPRVMEETVAFEEAIDGNAKIDDYCTGPQGRVPLSLMRTAGWKRSDEKVTFYLCSDSVWSWPPPGGESIILVKTRSPSIGIAYDAIVLQCM